MPKLKSGGLQKGGHCPLRGALEEKRHLPEAPSRCKLFECCTISEALAEIRAVVEFMNRLLHRVVVVPLFLPRRCRKITFDTDTRSFNSIKRNVATFFEEISRDSGFIKSSGNFGFIEGLELTFRLLQ